jgi:hypothetical protein
LSFYACHFADNKKECTASCPQNAENLKESEHTKDFFGPLDSQLFKAAGQAEAQSSHQRQ